MKIRLYDYNSDTEKWELIASSEDDDFCPVKIIHDGENKEPLY